MAADETSDLIRLLKSQPFELTNHLINAAKVRKILENRTGRKGVQKLLREPIAEAARLLGLEPDRFEELYVAMEAQALSRGPQEPEDPAEIKQ